MPPRKSYRPPEQSEALATLLSLLELEKLEENLFRGRSPQQTWQRIYGGHVIGQALMAAARTVEGRALHSMHAYFLLAGDPSLPIVYEVDRIRDGASFTTRRVKAVQKGRAIFSLSASFHKVEHSYDHQSTMPEVPAPEELPSERELKAKLAGRVPDNMRSYWQRERPIEVRPTDISRFLGREKKKPEQCIWLRANGPVGEDFVLHQCVLAYASDFTLLDTALIAHGKVLFDADIQLASLDHAMWFHRPFRADDWLLYVQDSPSAFGARGFCRGSVYTRDGVLVASVTQEGLIRRQETKFVPK